MRCAGCGADWPERARLCLTCGGTSSRDDVLGDMQDQARAFIASPAGKAVLGWGAAGAAAALVLPFVSWPAGLIVGGLAGWARHRNAGDDRDR